MNYTDAAWQGLAATLQALAGTLQATIFRPTAKLNPQRRTHKND